MHESQPDPCKLLSMGFEYKPSMTTHRADRKQAEGRVLQTEAQLQIEMHITNACPITRISTLENAAFRVRPNLEYPHTVC